MLNSILVEQFAGIHRTKKSGVLTVVGQGFRLRFCIENGDPVGLDFCADKDLVLAQALLDFHKIGKEVYQMVVESRRLGKGNVADMVQRQQVVNEDEINQVTRSMVEDSLVRCFSTPHQELSFDEQDDASTFDFDSSAIRLRIGTEVLLNTVQARVGEIDRVMNEVGGPDAVFNLSESESGSAPLSEFEKHVLNFIDGRKTVDEIAVAFRESTLNMSRLLHGMVAKGAVKRSSIGGISRLRAAVQPAASTVPMTFNAAHAAATPTLHPMSDFVPHRTTEGPPRSNRAVLTFLVSTLVLVSAVGYLVIEAHRRDAALDSAAQELTGNVVAGRWEEALAQVEKAKQEAGNDVVAIERVNSLQERISSAVTLETERISKLIEAQDYAAAQERLNLLPASLQPTDLRGSLQRGQNALAARSGAVLSQVTRLLENGQAAQAKGVIAGTKGREGEAAGDFLARWRLSSLERAGSSSLPLSQRLSLINQILATDPDSRQREQIERIRSDFARLQQRTADQIQVLRKQADLGAYLEVEAELERSRLAEQLRGTPLAGDAEALKQLNEQVAREMRALEKEGLALIETSHDSKAMGAYPKRVTLALEKWPLASNAKELKSLWELLTQLSNFVKEGKGSDEVAGLNAWLLKDYHPTSTVELVSGRIKRLQAVEDAANKSLETARAFARQNDWETNERMLKELLARQEWARTTARLAAQRDLDAIGSIKGQQQAWQEDLRKAMLKGDAEGSLAIAQKMGLRYLPLVIHSQPVGATVIRDGKSLGTTPLILDIPAGERSSLLLRVQLPDFDDLEVQASTAQGGWFLPVRLERSAIARYELKQTITSRPTAVDGSLWVASRQGAVALIPEQKPQRFAFENPGVADDSAQPLYAAAHGTADGVWYPTREGIAIRISKNGIERLPIAGNADLGLVDYTSELIVGRRFIILAGLDGALHAADDRAPLAAWHGPKGAAFVIGPVIDNDRVLATRIDGSIDIHLPDDGKLVGRHNLDGEILSAWRAADGLHAITSASHYVCAGEKQPMRTPLPIEIRSAGREVLLTPDNHAWIWSENSWKDIGRFEGKPTAESIQWSGHAVIPMGTTLAVVGPRGFVLRESSEFLPCEIVGTTLAVVTMEGTVRFYTP